MSTNETDREETESKPDDAAGVGPAADGSSSASAVESKDAESSTEDSAAADETPQSDASVDAEAVAAPTTPEPVAASSVASLARSASSAEASGAKSPGQRLAAQKAAKAAKKAADKSRRVEEAATAAEIEGAGMVPTAAPLAPDDVALRAAEVTGLVEKNQSKIMRGITAVAALIAVFGLVQMGLRYRAGSAGELLNVAIAASRAEVGLAPEIPDGRPRYETAAARERNTVRLLRKVTTSYPSSDAARRAHVALGSILLANEKFSDALREFRAAGAGLEDEPGLEAQVLEGVGVAQLGQHKYAEAARSFESLGRLDRRRYRDLADYQLARAAFDRGDRDGAKTNLVALLARLDRPNATPSDHVQDQSRNLLRQIDPSALPAPAAPNGLTPEILRMLQQQGLNLGGLGQ